MSLKSNALYQTIAGAQKKNDNQTKMATVSSITSEGIFLKFYGEDTASQKPYKRLSSYSPTVGDTVILQKVGSSYLITGKVV